MILTVFMANHYHGYMARLPAPGLILGMHICCIIHVYIYIIRKQYIDDLLAMCPTWYGSALRYLHLYIPFVGEIPWSRKKVRPLDHGILKWSRWIEICLGGWWSQLFPHFIYHIYLYLGYFNIFYIGWWSKMAKDFSGLKPPAISCFTADPASFRSNRQGRSAASMHVGKLDSFNFIHMSYSFAQWNMSSK